MKLANGVTSCTKVDRRGRSNEPYCLVVRIRDPYDLLPESSQSEEMLIVRVLYIVQYKCSGHNGSFICNTGRIYDELPFLQGS
jgi:hypothetical protein